MAMHLLPATGYSKLGRTHDDLLLAGRPCIFGLGDLNTACWAKFEGVSFGVMVPGASLPDKFAGLSGRRVAGLKGKRVIPLT